MSGKKSSVRETAKKRDISLSAGLHDFLYVIGKNYWVFLVMLAFFIIAIPFFTAGLPGDSIFNVEVTHDQLKYRLIHENALQAVLTGCLFFGLVDGIVSFKFIQDKKETTIFFSLGLTRTRLFINRCLSGVLMLFVSIAIPMFISLGLNVHALGAYDGVIRDTFYILAGLTAATCVSYFVTIIVCVLAGTMAETVVYWCGLMATPYVVCYSLNTLMKTLFWGNPWGAVTYTQTETVRPDLMEKFSWADPCTFFYGELKTHAQFMRPLSSAVPPAVQPKVLIAWCVIAVVLLILAVVFVKHRKAEVAGIAGTNRCLSEWLIAVTAFLGFTFIYTFLHKFSPVLAIVLGITGFAVVHLFWRKALFSYGKGRLRYGISLAAGIAAVLIICGGAYTGGFGSAQKYLKNSQPEVAKVSYVGAPGYLSESADGSSTGRGYYMLSQISYQEQDSIDKIKEIQQELIDCGRMALATDEETFSNTVVPYDLIFAYTDADGSEHVWYYDRVSLKQLDELLALEDTAESKSKQKALFDGSLENEQTVWADAAYQNGTVYLTDSYCSQTFELSVSGGQRQELLKSIEADKIEGPFKERYFPTDQTRAVLMFSQNGEYDCEYYAYNLDNAFVYVTDQDENTISWLNANGLLDIVSGQAQVESVTLQKFDPYIGINGMKYPMGMYFMSYRADSLDEFLIQKDFGTKYTITDEEKIRQLLPGLRNGYYMTKGGYLAAVKIAGKDGYVYMFLPADQVPGFVKG